LLKIAFKRNAKQIVGVLHADKEVQIGFLKQDLDFEQGRTVFRRSVIKLLKKIPILRICQLRQVSTKQLGESLRL